MLEVKSLLIRIAQLKNSNALSHQAASLIYSVKFLPNLLIAGLGLLKTNRIIGIEKNGVKN